jgi:hypothetical protein
VSTDVKMEATHGLNSGSVNGSPSGIFEVNSSMTFVTSDKSLVCSTVLGYLLVVGFSTT